MEKRNVSKYVGKFNLTDDRRFASFDFCYNYFKTTSSEDLIKNMQSSTTMLWSYLASWGMLRGSSRLFQEENWFYLKPLVKYIAEQPKTLWDLDVEDWDDDNINLILKIYNDVKDIVVKKGSDPRTLVTKILLGVFGIVPAYDTYFSLTFSRLYLDEGKVAFQAFNKQSLQRIKMFYDDNKEEIDHLQSTLFTIDFNTGSETNINHTKAKIIDVYGFNCGIDIVREAEEAKKIRK